MPPPHTTFLPTPLPLQSVQTSRLHTQCRRPRQLTRAARRRPPIPIRMCADSKRPPDTALSFSTAASTSPSLSTALTDATSRALANLSPGGPPTLAIVYVSVRYSVSKIGPSGRDTLDLVVPKLRALVPALSAVLGCTSDGVIGTGPDGAVFEIEDSAAISVTLARLPAINVHTFHVMPDDLPSLDASQSAWRSLVGRPAPDASPPAFIILSDPTFATRGDLERFLSGLEYAYPASSVVGALASTGAASATGHLYCTLPRDILSADSSSLRDTGLVGISLTGDVELDCLVSPGCRPIGPLLEVRKVLDNTLLELELAGRPSTSLSAVGHLKSVLSYATPQERLLIQDNLHIGIPFDQFTDSSDAADYLIRTVLGVDMEGGGIALGQRLRPGQRVRFFIKERDSARDILDATMQKYKRVELANSLVGYSNPPFGAMVFVDAARGKKLFKEPAVETRNLTSFAAGVPVTGFFGSAQIGPSRSGPEGRAGPSVVHNATNLIALVRRRSGMTPSEPIDSPSTSAADLDDPEQE